MTALWSQWERPGGGGRLRPGQQWSISSFFPGRCGSGHRPHDSMAIQSCRPPLRPSERTVALPPSRVPWPSIKPNPAHTCPLQGTAVATTGGARGRSAEGQQGCPGAGLRRISLGSVFPGKPASATQARGFEWKDL